MPLYESVYITRPDISATQVEALTAELTKILEENGGKVVTDEYWGLKSLAYKIKKNRKAHYSLLNIDAPATALSEMERNMRLHDDILRYMSIRVDEHEDGQSIMMQHKTSRDERSRGRDRDEHQGQPQEGEAMVSEGENVEPATVADNREIEQ